MTNSRIYWLCQFSGWLLFVLIMGFFLWLSNKLTPGGNLKFSELTVDMIKIFSLGIFSSHLMRNYIVRNNWIKLNAYKLIIRVILISILFSFFFFIGDYVITSIIEQDFTFELSIGVLFLNIIAFSAIYLLWSMIYFLVHYFYIYRTAEINFHKMEAEFHKIELNTLRSQLNPHFLFNAMNSIRALISEDANRAKESITKLSILLRNTLIQNKRQLISLKDEIEIIKDYLHLEKVRFEERLKYELHICERCTEIQLPPLLLQTLVENAIKHGVSKLTNGGVININAEILKDNLVIIILNDGFYETPNNENKGIGLETSIKRLEFFYGKSASLKIYNENNKVKTELIIPKNPKNTYE